MDLFKCNEPRCTLRGIHFCKCASPPYFLCENHVGSHTNHLQKTSLPDTYVSHAELKILNLNDLCSTYQNYLFPTSTSDPYIFKCELSPIVLPDRYKEYFKELIWYFINRIRDIPRNESERILREEMKLLKTLQKKVMNLKIELGTVRQMSINKFNDIDDRMLKISFDFIKDSLGSSLKDEHSPLFSKTKKIIESFNEIQTCLREGESNLKILMNLLKEKLSDYVINENLHLRQLEILRKKVEEEVKRAKEEWEKQIFEYLMKAVIDKEFLQFVFFRAANFDGFKEQVFKPEWVACENLLLIKEDIELCCIEQLYLDSYISLLKFKDSKMTGLISISSNNLSISLLKMFNDTNIIIPSGISELSLILIQNYPRTLFYYMLTDNNLREDTSKRFVTETNFDITSAAYLSWKDTIVLITSSNEIIAKNISNNSNPEKIQVDLAHKEQLLDIQSKSSKKLIFLRTSIYYIIFDDCFRELFRFKALGINVSVFDEYTSSRLLFVSIYEGKVRSWEIHLSEDQRRRLSINLEQPNLLSKSLLSLTSRLLNRRVSTAEEDSVYSKFVETTLPPLEIRSHPNDPNKSIILTDNYWSLSPSLINNPQQVSNNIRVIEIQEHGKLSINPFQSRKPPPLSSNLTIAHCRDCGERFPNNANICENKHFCAKLCEIEGMCSKYGRNYCCVETGRSSSHTVHNCSSKFHSCPVKCPVKDCIVYCSRKVGHGGLHKCDVHYGPNGKSCNNECFGVDHKHFVECRCGPVRGVNHSETENMDLFESGCEEFWKSHGWEGFNAIGIKLVS